MNRPCPNSGFSFYLEAMFQRMIFSYFYFRSAAAACAISLTLLGSSLSAQDLDNGKKMYQICTACHGAEGHGNQVLNAPQIAGLDAVYLETQLRNWKEGIRGAHPDDTAGLQMRPMSMTLKDEETIKDVAAYVATLEAKIPEATLEGGDATKGQAAYAVCLACHGPDAGGNAALKSPSLRHQNDWYMLAQLKKFKSGIRGSNPKDVGGMQMRPMSMTLVDEQAMKDVIAHIRSLAEK